MSQYSSISPDPDCDGISVIIPVCNEADALPGVLHSLKIELESVKVPFELIVIDDGSTDSSRKVAEEAGVVLMSHAQQRGYGLAIRSGLAIARYDLVAIIDGDGTYGARDLIEIWGLRASFDMVVGARGGAAYWSSVAKSFGRRALILLCEAVCGAKIPDINSGLRVFRRRDALRFAEFASYGFSFTTSLTLCFLLNGYSVGYRPIVYDGRRGVTKVRHVRDALRTLQRVVEICARFNPLKLYLFIGVGFLFGAILLLCIAVSGIGSWRSVTFVLATMAVVSLLLGQAVAAAGVFQRQPRPIERPLERGSLKPSPPRVERQEGEQS